MLFLVSILVLILLIIKTELIISFYGGILPFLLNLLNYVDINILSLSKDKFIKKEKINEYMEHLIKIYLNVGFFIVNICIDCRRKRRKMFEKNGKCL